MEDRGTNPSHDDDSMYRIRTARPTSVLVAMSNRRHAARVGQYAATYNDVVVVRSFSDAVAAVTQSPPRRWAAAIIATSLLDGSGFGLLDALRAVDPQLPALLVANQSAALCINPAFAQRALLVVAPVRAGDVKRFLGSAEVAHAKQRTMRDGSAPTQEAAIEALTRAWSDDFGLTPVECEALTDAILGLSSRQMALARGISDSAAKSRVNRLLAKTQAKNLPQIAHAALSEMFFGERVNWLVRTQRESA